MIHLNKFIDLVRGADARQLRDIHMSVKDAKDLHADITKLLITLETLREAQKTAEQPEVITVDVSGGSF